MGMKDIITVTIILSTIIYIYAKIIYSLNMSNFLDHKVFEIRTLFPSLNNPTSLFLKERNRKKPTFN